MPETDQVAAIKANDERVLTQLYKANYMAVERFVIQNNGTGDDAKDIYQEAFLAVWRNIQLDKFLPQHNNALDAYLQRVAKNKWLDHLRSAGFKKTLPLQEPAEALMTSEESDDSSTDKIRLIKEKFQLLGDNCRDLLGRFYYRKQSLKEIAGTLGWTEATAKNNKYRCMEKLREMLK